MWSDQAVCARWVFVESRPPISASAPSTAEVPRVMVAPMLEYLRDPPSTRSAGGKVETTWNETGFKLDRKCEALQASSASAKLRTPPSGAHEVLSA